MVKDMFFVPLSNVICDMLATIIKLYSDKIITKKRMLLWVFMSNHNPIKYPNLAITKINKK